MSQAAPAYDGSEIAVVGMAGRFPGAEDLDAFWKNLASGVESITRFSERELRDAGEDAKLLADPRYVPARPILEDVELFDAAFFGFTPREAEVLDPQLRVFLESAHCALEHAGYDPQRLPGRASLYAGASFSNYLVHNLYKNRPVMEAFGDMQATILNVQDSLVTMVGYKLNLKGACCAVQTFCSTSLVSVHLASQNLLGYESDVTLAGGVTVYVPQNSGYLYEEGSILSRRGRCRAFDAEADGTVFGNGVGVVVLRRLADALRDGDTVHAVIRGSAVNNDGSLKVSFAAPGVVGQTEVVVEALSAAGVDAETIGYVETHGTGTHLGDPVEVSALIKAFRTRTQRRGFCALGSVKTNIGHLDAAAGVAGLVKTILSLKHEQIPPSLHFETANPAIDFAGSPFFVNDKLREWPRGENPRRAGVSAFGVGGTNAHVIVEEGPAVRSEPSARTHQLLVVSAKTPSALTATAQKLAAHLESHPELELADVAFTLQLGRGSFAYRTAVVSSSLAEAATALRGLRPPTAPVERRNPPVVLVLHGPPGPSSAWDDLGKEETVFRDARVAFGENSGAGDAGRLESASIEHAMGRLFESWGVRFEAVAGEGPDAMARVLRLELDGGSGRLLDGFESGGGGPVVPVTRAGLLELLGGLWRAGVEPDWTALHASERRRRVPLPTYPFERERCWVDPVPEGPKAAGRVPGDWLYRPVWKRSLPGVPVPPPRRVLIFLDERGVGARVAVSLRGLGAEVTTVAIGSGFAGAPETGYVVDPADPRDYTALFADLEGRQRKAEAVVHLWSLDPVDRSKTPADRFRRASERGFYSLLHVVRGRSDGPLALLVVSAGLHDVVGGEVLEPEKAPLLALCRVAGQEHHDVVVSSVEVETAMDADAAAQAVLAELLRERDDAVVAWRRGRRWGQHYEAIPRGLAERAAPLVRERGVYLITGGLGDVGFVLGSVLAQAAKARLVLTGRRTLPPREGWQSWLASHDALDETALRIRRVRALEAAGADVLYATADASSPEEMRAVLRAARERHGALHGVIHAAGELSADTFRTLRELDHGACERQFAPKVHGLFALAEAIGEEPLDFCLLTSSLSSVLGGVGYAAYAGANAFLDAFAAAHRGRGQNLVSVDWDQWEFPGRSVRGAARQAAREGATLKPEEGVAVFERVLRLRDVERVVVSTTPLAARLERWVRPQDTAGQDVKRAAAARPRPRLSAEYVAPRSEGERRLAEIWQELLGLDAVGVHDNFFELGGHSLFAARMLSRVRGAFEVALPLEAVFEAPTVAELAARLQAAEWALRPPPPAEASTERIEIEI